MGNWDEEAIKSLLTLNPDYVGVVASPKRFRAMARNIHQDGVSQEQLDSIKCPAGLDMPVRTLQETALSIAAEIVSIRRSRKQQAANSGTTAAVAKSTAAEDPVCHMTVDPAMASAPVQFEGTAYYFCSEHCKRNFEKDPRKYVSVEAKA
jgi:xanthine dehydrogenase accessory factor